MNPGKCCTLRIENIGELGLVRCLLIPNSKIRIQIKAYKRKAQATYPCPAEENGFR